MSAFIPENHEVKNPSTAVRFDLKWAGHHDIWNIVWLTAVISVTIYYLLYSTPENLQLFSFGFCLYLAADFMWIAVLPMSVSSPVIVMFHHVVTICIIGTLPFLDPRFARALAFPCLIEASTVTRILRKKFRDSKLVNFLFYFSWISTRFIAGPYAQYHLTLGVMYPTLYNVTWLSHDANYMLKAFLFIFGVILNSMSAKWSYDLLVLGGGRLRHQKGL
jgi:hypothetical protein